MAFFIIFFIFILHVVSSIAVYDLLTVKEYSKICCLILGLASLFLGTILFLVVCCLPDLAMRRLPLNERYLSK